MASLVPIPWQPSLYLTPSTLGYLQRASQRVGQNLMLSTSDAAWRSEARQQYLWDVNGHNPAKANDPKVGQRSHMRGAAFDLARTDATAQAACRAVGLVRDANEQWHWNDPSWANMPIIPTNTATAGGGSIPISAEEAKNMFTLFNIPNEGIWVRSLITGNRAHVQTPYHVSLLQRYRVENDTMLGAECDIVVAYLSAINPGAGTQVQDQLRRDLGSIRGGDVEMSLTKIAAAVAAVKAPTLTPEQLVAIGKAITVPTPPTKFVITGEAKA